jgi:hypothetical protein
MSYLRNIINRRITQKSKKEHLLSARKEGDIKLIQSKDVRKVKNFKGKPVGKNKRVVNNAYLAPITKRTRVANYKEYQEVDKKKQFKPDKNNHKPLKKLENERFIRVVNNLFRNEESVLDQRERMLYNHNMTRELSQKLNGIKFGEDKKIANIIKLAHVAEKQAQVDANEQFLSQFTGPTKSLVEIPQLKQELDPNMKIKTTDLIKADDQEKAIKEFIDKLTRTKSPREQAKIQFNDKNK